MKSRKRLFGIIFTIFQLLILSGCKEYLYPIGKDTIESFGKGTYQIVRSGKGDSMTLFSFYKENGVILSKSLEDEVIDYKLVGSYLYVYGTSGYTLIDLTNNKVIHDNILNNIPKKQKGIFISLEIR